MKYYALILFLLLACSQVEQAATPVAEPVDKVVIDEPVQEAKEIEQVDQVQEQVQEPQIGQVQVQAEQVVQPEIIEPVSENSRSILYDFQDVFAQEVKGYSFLYNGDEYFVRGTKYKIILLNSVTVRNADFSSGRQSVYYYDTIYVDRATETAIAKCQGHQDFVNRQCTQLDLKGLEYPVDYEDYSITLPEEWLIAYRDIRPSSTEIGKYQLNKYGVDLVHYDLVPSVSIFVESKSGLPIKVEIGTAPTVSRYDYQKLTTNKVKPADVQP